MTFKEFAEANKKRNEEKLPDWSIIRLGEQIAKAANNLEKLIKNEFDNPFYQEQHFIECMSDIFCYLQTIADKRNMNLEDTIKIRFNDMSEKLGSSIQL